MHRWQLTDIRQTRSWLAGNPCFTRVLYFTDPGTLSLLSDSSHNRCLQSTLHQSNLKWCSGVFTIKVNILCFVCTADASLGLDHLNRNVVCRKQPSIHVYVAWNIKIDISNFPVSKVGRQDMAVAYGHIERAYSINSKKDTRVSSLQFCQLQTCQKWYQMQFLIMIDGSQMQAFTLVVKRLTFNPEKTFLSMNKVILLLKSNHTRDLNANRGLHSHSLYFLCLPYIMLVSLWVAYGGIDKYIFTTNASSFFVGYIDIQQTLNVTQ